MSEMIRASSLVTYFTALSLGAAGLLSPAMAGELGTSNSADSEHLVQDRELLRELLDLGEMFTEEFKELTPEGEQPLTYFESQGSAVAIPGQFQPTVRYVHACTDAPLTDKDATQYTLYAGLLLSVSADDLADKDMTTDDFFSEYAVSFTMVMQNLIGGIVKEVGVEAATAFSSEFLQAYNSAAKDVFVSFEEHTGITAQMDLVTGTLAPHEAACGHIPQKMRV